MCKDGSHPLTSLTPNQSNLQVLRAVAARNDGGAALSGGTDCVLLTHVALVPVLLGMLHALGPPARWRAPQLQQQQSGPQHSPGDTDASSQLPVSEAVRRLAARYPKHPPFQGYRSAVLSGGGRELKRLV